MKACVCDTCRVIVANGDWTVIDGMFDASQEDEATAMIARIEANMEHYGYLAYVGDADKAGYWHCDLCWEIQCGGGTTFEGGA